MILFTLTPAAYNNYKEIKFKKMSEDMTKLLEKVESKVVDANSSAL